MIGYGSYMQKLFIFSLSEHVTCFISIILLMLYQVFLLIKSFDKLLIFPTIVARQRGREDENGVVILDSDDDEDGLGPSNPPRVGDPGQGNSRDGGRGGGDDDDDGGGDSTKFYRLLGM